MSSMESAQLENLKREFEEIRDRVWQDPSIPPHQKQAQLYKLWQEFDSQRTALREGTLQGETGGEPVSLTTGRPVIFPRKRRPPWK